MEQIKKKKKYKSKTSITTRIIAGVILLALLATTVAGFIYS